jgi:predicted nucleic acid-binding protein
MTVMRIYLDTSVWSLAISEGVSEYREASKDIFEHAKLFDWRLVSSEIVLGEFEGFSPKQRKLAFDLVEESEAEIWIAEDEIHALANDYIGFEVVTRNHFLDSLHVATATIAECDLLLSWNFRHIANINKARKFIAVNEIRGYNKPIKICTPMEAYEI